MPMPDIWQPSHTIAVAVVDQFAAQVRRCKSYNLHFGRGLYAMRLPENATSSDILVKLATVVLDAGRKQRRATMQAQVCQFADEYDRKRVCKMLYKIISRVEALGPVKKCELHDTRNA
jgi:hypothetical protein